MPTSKGFSNIAIVGEAETRSAMRPWTGSFSAVTVGGAAAGARSARRLL